MHALLRIYVSLIRICNFCLNIFWYSKYLTKCKDDLWFVYVTHEQHVQNCKIYIFKIYVLSCWLHHVCWMEYYTLPKQILEYHPTRRWLECWGQNSLAQRPDCRIQLWYTLTGVHLAHYNFLPKPCWIFRINSNLSGVNLQPLLPDI